MCSYRRATRDTIDAYLLEGPKAAGRPRKTADTPFADCDANQLTKEELVQSLNACTTTWLANATEASDQVRARQIRRVVSRDGIAVLQFARGDELKMLQEEAVDRATRLPKITIQNETEVIESVPTANEMGGVTHHRCARLCADAILFTKRSVNAGHGAH